MPPPTATPSIAHIVGTGRFWKARSDALKLETNGPTSAGVIVALSFKSAPIKITWCLFVTLITYLLTKCRKILIHFGSANMGF